MLTIPAAPAAPATPGAALVILAPNCGDLVQQAYIAVPARSPQAALLEALDALDAHCDRHGYIASIETHATYRLLDGRYLVVTD